MGKNYLFPVLIGLPLVNTSKIYRKYGDSILFPTIDNVLNVQSPDIGKPDIYRRKDKVSQQPISIVAGHSFRFSNLQIKKTVADLPKLYVDRYPARLTNSQKQYCNHRSYRFSCICSWHSNLHRK
jgi:hypothetical protein